MVCNATKRSAKDPLGAIWVAICVVFSTQPPIFGEKGCVRFGATRQRWMVTFHKWGDI
jgi:hypothetical protein